MEFKKLEIKQESNWFKRIIKSTHLRKTLLYAVLGGVVGFGYFYFAEGKHLNIIETGDVLRSVLLGAAFGVFITNSPCARGRC